MKFINLVYIVLLVFSISCNKSQKNIINDVTGLNPVTVEKIIVPTTTEEIKEAVKSTTGAISIGGGRYSMGGQTSHENSLHIDMRSFNKVLHLDVENKKITVQAGATWRDLQEAIDPHNLSIKIMQTYSNFTVGGSLSVNVHGRYVGEGPIIRSVESIKLVLADGNEVKATSNENSELFYSAIGGYGGVGVITEATLHLTNNEVIGRKIKMLPMEQYRKYFIENIRNNKSAVFHNGDIYPPEYKDVSLETWYKTKDKLTIPLRLIPRNQKYWLEPNVISSISSLPYGKEVRQNILDPIVNANEKVVHRNYEASYDVAQLEPKTPRLLFTYVLQEYFVPVEQFEKFIPKMREIFKKYNVNVINVSIRHALKDSGSYLAWAPEEVFSFVVYYKQQTHKKAQEKVKVWTQELIDAAISVGGRHYLPYQVYATKEQFKKEYKDNEKLFVIKRKYDPDNKFRNKIWTTYY